MKNTSSSPRQEANQTVRLEIDSKAGASSIRISFTDQRLTAHGGMAIWSHHLKQRGLRQQLRQVLPVRIRLASHSKRVLELTLV